VGSALEEDSPAPLGIFAEWAAAARLGVKELVHFYTALVGEGIGLFKVAPGFARELFRSGVYGSDLTFRKLPYRRELADLARLRAWNPDWVFREDFDPRDWLIVFLHGYIDNTGADRVAYKLARLGYQVYLVRYPFLQSVRRTAVGLMEVLETIQHREHGKRPGVRPQGPERGDPGHQLRREAQCRRASVVRSFHSRPPTPM